MLTNFFGKSKPINYVVILLLILAYFSFSILRISWGETVGMDRVIEQVGLFLLILFYCFMFGFILAKNKLTLDNSFGFLILVSLFGFFPEVYQHSETLIFNIIILIFFRKVVSFRTSKAFFEKLFDSGFWLAVLFILEPFSALFGILIYVAVSLFQKTTYQTILIPIIGFITPLLLYFAYCFWYDLLGNFYALFYWYSPFSIEMYSVEEYYIPMLFIGVLSVVTLLIKTPKVFLVSGNYRKYWIMITSTFAISILYVVLKPEKNGAELLLTFFPIAIMIANWIESIQRKIVKEIVLVAFLILPALFFIL